MSQIFLVEFRFDHRGFHKVFDLGLARESTE